MGRSVLSGMKESLAGAPGPEPPSAVAGLALRRRVYERFRSGRVYEPLLAALVVLGLAEAIVRTGLVSSPDLPAPSLIARALYEDVQHVEVWTELGATFSAWALGLGAAIVAGIALGVLLGLNGTVYAVTQPTMEFIRTVPSIAALPLLILVLGVGQTLAFVVVVQGALFPVLLQTMYGVRDVDPVAKEVGRVYGLSRHQIVRRVTLPTSLPYIATGIRIASLMALLLAVSASLIAGGSGIGYAIYEAMSGGDPALMYARIVLLGFAGVAIAVVIGLIEKRLLFWHATQRQVAT
jgi:NitT/TauT family transport system permease protein